MPTRALTPSTPGGLLDPNQTTLSPNARRTMQNLVAQGIAPNIARQLAIALNKSSIAKAETPRKSYHQAFAEAAKAILPKAMVNMLHVNARAIAGGHGKAAKWVEAGEQVMKAEGQTPPKGVQAACRRGLELAPEYGGPGLTEGAKARARSMAAGNAVSPANLRRMKSFFARHGSYEKQASPPSPGYVSWLLWGGDAGRSWANAKAEAISKAGFDESAHPRADNGEFSAGGGGSSAPKESERFKAERDKHLAAAREADARGDYKAANSHREAGVKANKEAIKAIRAEGKSRVKEIREEGKALKQSREADKPERSQQDSADPKQSESPKPTATDSSKAEPAAHVDQKDGESHSDAASRHAEERLAHIERAEKALKSGDRDGFNAALSASKRSAKAFEKHHSIAEKNVAEEVRSLLGRLDALSGKASSQKREISRRNRALDRAPVAKAARLLSIVKGQAPMGAAFSHARASGKKQDHESRKRRANKWLMENGHDKIAKMTPLPADVRAEQFLRIVQGGKNKKRKPADGTVEATQKSVAVHVPATIVKSEQTDWQRLVWSVVYEPDTVDAHGDFMDAQTIEKAAHNALREGIYVNSEHRGEPLPATVVESYIAPCDFTMQAAGGDTVIRKGTWVMGMHVTDDAAWQGVLDGTYRGFSLEGLAMAHAA